MYYLKVYDDCLWCISSKTIYLNWFACDYTNIGYKKEQIELFLFMFLWNFISIY